MPLVRTFLVLAIGLLVTLGFQGSAQAAGELGLSPDGTHWAATLPNPLFDPAFRWVPGDSEVASFFVRNQSADAAVLDVTMLTGPLQTLIETGDLTVGASVDSGPFTDVSTPGTQALIRQVPVASGASHKINVRVTFDPASTNQSQSTQLDLRFTVALTQAASVQPPTNGGGTGHGGQGGHGGTGSSPLPNTGSVVTPSMLLLAAVLCASGIGLVGYSRRRTPRPEERPSHVEA
ncbi:MAG: hypothetical protein JWQ32_412 [Marmoricola sp.]|nr:hypothetical protein [Marmoricola sp.]